MDDETLKVIGIVFAFLVLFGKPAYDFFAGRAAAKKATEDQFHARINELVKQAAKQEGITEGRAQAFSEMAIFMQMAEHK